MFNPKIEKMATAVMVENFIDGSSTEPYKRFCHWNGSFEVSLLGMRARPSWELATLKMWFDAKINERSRIWLGGRDFSVLHAENVELRGKYSIVKVGRLIGLKSFKMFSPYEVRDEVGGVDKKYHTARGEFEAAVYPYSSESAAESYGVDLNYSCEVYTMNLNGIKEMDAFGAESPEYEVKTIEDWGYYYKIIAEELKHGLG